MILIYELKFNIFVSIILCFNFWKNGGNLKELFVEIRNCMIVYGISVSITRLIAKIFHIILEV